jgi:ATP sulfurylase
MSIKFSQPHGGTLINRVLSSNVRGELLPEKFTRPDVSRILMSSIQERA